MVLNELAPHWDQLAMLGVSGLGGAYFRAFIQPEPNWQKRVGQGLAGALSAIFLGGLVAHFINVIAHAGVFAYLAGGFLMGSGGELSVKALQDKILGKVK